MPPGFHTVVPREFVDANMYPIDLVKQYVSRNCNKWAACRKFCDALEERGRRGIRDARHLPDAGVYAKKAGRPGGARDWISLPEEVSIRELWDECFREDPPDPAPDPAPEPAPEPAGEPAGVEADEDEDGDDDEDELTLRERALAAGEAALKARESYFKACKWSAEQHAQRVRDRNNDERDKLKRAGDDLAAREAEFAKKMRGELGRCAISSHCEDSDEDAHPVVCRKCGFAACDRCLEQALIHGSVEFRASEHDGGACVEAACPGKRGCRGRVTVADLLAGRRDSAHIAAIVGPLVTQAADPVVVAAKAAARSEAVADGEQVARAESAWAVEALYGPGQREPFLSVARAIPRVRDLATVAECPGDECNAHLVFRLPQQQEIDCMSMQCTTCKQYVCSMCLAHRNADGTPFDYDDVHEHVVTCVCRDGLRDDGEAVGAALEHLGEHGPVSAEVEDAVRRDPALVSFYVYQPDRAIAMARGRLMRVHEFLRKYVAERGETGEREKALIHERCRTDAACVHACETAGIAWSSVGVPGPLYF